MTKKTMIAIAALCGAVAAQAVESDVVGYTTTGTLESGNKALGVSFNAVSGTMNLQDVKVVGYTGAFEGNVNMQTLDAYGYTDKTYFWVDLPKDEEDPDSEAFYGWYDENDELVDKSVLPGDGFWTFSDSASYGIQSAGKVIKAPSAIGLKESGNSLVANPLATSVDIQDVAVIGYTGAFEGNVNMQTLDSLGYTDKTFFWVDLPKDEEDPDSEAFYGWYDENDELVEKDINVGEGLWVFSDNNAYSIAFPSINL